MILYTNTFWVSRAKVVQTAIKWINYYPVDRYQENNNYVIRLDEDLSGGLAPSTFCGQMVLKSVPNRNDAGAWARSHLLAPITYQSVQAQSALIITDSDNAVSHTKLLSAHFRTSTVFCPPAK